MTISAVQILDAIRAKHSDDVVVHECKNGPTQGVDGYLRMDAWVMTKSWAHPNSICYEIKVTRGDFLRDKKMREYLPYCNELYIAAPFKMIEKSEIPKECGLIELCGSVLRIKKKAPYRDIEIPESLYRYVLMCRTRVIVEHGGFKKDRQYWESWVRQKKEDREFGYNVGYNIRKMLNEKVDKVERENHVLKRQIQEYEEIKKFCLGLGLMEKDFISKSDVEQKVKEYNRTVPRSMIWDLEQVRDAINSVLEEDKNQVDRLNLQARVVK